MNVIVCSVPEFKKGDPSPSGFLAKMEWAEIQLKHGLRQEICGSCGKWYFPQERIELSESVTKKFSNGNEIIAKWLCVKCIGKVAKKKK